VPRFDHTDAGRPEEAWRALERWGDLPVLEPSAADGGRPDRLVVVVAHPDDESLAMAGVLAWSSDQAVPCHVVVATDGEGSHPHSRTHSPERLAEIRRAEVVAAVGRLAPGACVHRLELPDGLVADTPGPLEEALVDLVGPRTLLVSTWRHDAHPDHEAVARVCAEVAVSCGARHLEAPIWLWHWGSPADVPWQQARRLDLDEEARRRRAQALATYVSQHTALSPRAADAPVLGPGMLAHFDRPFEVYVEHGHDEGPGRTTTGVFERLHRGQEDPWSLADSWYERRKRHLTLAALPAARLGRVLEVGCSVGVLTAQLARRADEVVAVDVSEAALGRARRLVGGEHVRFERRRVPQQWPEGAFDTVVLSEIGYFLTRPQWTECLGRAFVCARDSVVAVHWRHAVDGWPLDGPVCHELARAVARSHGYEVATSVVDDDFLIDLFRREERAGIAELEGKT
jgi:LmbE family N-acetylglucosaminyl deacetylase/SAM-dependent methyltransferase